MGLDPAASLACQVSAPCPNGDDPGWCYMLGYDIGNIWAQCPTCHDRFWHATGFGVGGGPDRTFGLTL